MSRYENKRGSAKALKVKLCANCNHALEALPISEENPKGVVKCKWWGFRGLNDFCGKWQVRM